MVPLVPDRKQEQMRYTKSQNYTNGWIRLSFRIPDRMSHRKEVRSHNTGSIYYRDSLLISKRYSSLLSVPFEVSMIYYL